MSKRATGIEKYAKHIDKLWEDSNHGTRREDVEAAFLAGFNAAMNLRNGNRVDVIDLAADDVVPWLSFQEYDMSDPTVPPLVGRWTCVPEENQEKYGVKLRGRVIRVTDLVGY